MLYVYQVLGLTLRAPPHPTPPFSHVTSSLPPHAHLFAAVMTTRFPGGWVLVNTRHAEFPLVRDTFLTPHRGPVPEEQIGKALGYPTLDNGGTIT